MSSRIKAADIARVAIIAAIYAVITLVFAPISYGFIQVRVSEALTILPFFDPHAILGLFLGVIIANLAGGLGIYDIIGGSLCTLVAAYLTYLTSKIDRPLLAPLPPVIVNALGVSVYLHLILQPPDIFLPLVQRLSPYWAFVLSIGIGEFIACYLLGYPLLLLIRRRRNVFDFIVRK